MHEPSQTPAGSSSMTRWVGPSALAILDQGLWSGGNFVVSLVLARELGVGQFGLFTAAYTVLMLFAALHSALVSEPMMVLGAKKGASGSQRYVATVMGYGFVAAAAPAALAAVLGVFFLVRMSNGTGTLLVVFGLSAPFIMMGWVARRACYVTGAYGLAAAATTVHSAVVVGVTVAILASGAMSASMAVIPYAVAGASIAAVISIGLRLRYESLTPRTIRGIHAEHWRFGQWSVSAAALAWLASQSYFVFIPLVLSHAANGAVRALGLLILPAMQSFSALGLVLVPRLSRATNDGTFASSLRGALTVFVTAGLLYAAVLVAFPSQIIQVVLGGAYADYVQVAQAYALLPAISGVATVLSSGLRAGHWPKDVLLGALASAATTATIGLWATNQFGALGAVGGMVIAAFVAMVTQAFRLRYRIGLHATQLGRTGRGDGS